MTTQNRESGLVPNAWTQLVEKSDAPAAVGTLIVEVGECHITATAETDLELLAKIYRALRSL
jgi:hypothetical protein